MDYIVAGKAIREVPMPLATRSRSRVRYVPGAPLPAGEVVFTVFVLAIVAFAVVDKTRYLPEPAGDLVTLAAAILAAQVLVLLGISSENHRRCVDTQTMSVLPDQACQPQAQQAQQAQQSRPPFEEPSPVVCGGEGE
jgi:hypothetical protein